MIFRGKYEWAGRPGVGDCSLRVLQVNKMQIPERCVILLNLEREDSSKAFEIIEHETWKGTIQAKHLKQWNMSFKQYVVETVSMVDTKCSRDSVCERWSVYQVQCSQCVS